MSPISISLLLHAFDDEAPNFAGEPSPSRSNRIRIALVLFTIAHDCPLTLSPAGFLSAPSQQGPAHRSAPTGR